MASADAENFRLAVLNPAGRDPEQHFTGEERAPDNQHAPVNFHAYAACNGGAFFRQTKRALASEWPVLLLLRGDFRETERALRELQRAKRRTAVALKESGAHQIAQQLRDPVRLARFLKIARAANGCIAPTPEGAELFSSFRIDRVAYIPTPYPIDDGVWDFAVEQRSGIFVGTREFDVPSRHHLAALLAARKIGDATGERVTTFNLDGAKGAKLMRALEFPADRIRLVQGRLSYRDYLREVARHKIVFQFDRSHVPGQVAGDTLLCGGVCVGGDGAIERIAFPETCGENRSDQELVAIAEHLLRDEIARRTVAEDARKLALEKLSFRTGRENLAHFFASL